FHHPLIRTVTYESQLKSDRAEMHRRLAAAIQERNPESVDENAALIAEHLEAAGDLRAAFNWHMRAGAWSATPDVVAAGAAWGAGGGEGGGGGGGGGGGCGRHRGPHRDAHRFSGRAVRQRLPSPCRHLRRPL